MQDLLNRADHRCELCEGTTDLAAFGVAPHDDGALAHTILTCATCRAQLADGAVLDATHWFCLQAAIWSGVPAVQVVALRLLERLKDHSFAAALLADAMVEDEVRAWAQDGAVEAPGNDRPSPVDSNGARLADGDDVTLIKDLEVKGAGFTAKRGTLVKGIRTTDDPALIEGKVNGMQIVLKTCFLKRAG